MVSIWVIAVILMLTAAVVSVLNHPQVKGIMGERKARKQLSRLPSESYRVLNDIVVKTKTGSSQIDHVVISPHGIFVIETKNYKGWIHGREDSEYWTQTIFRTKTKFRNPIKQNWAHIYALREILPEHQDISYHPVILFVGKAKLMNLDVKTDVIHPEILYDTITRPQEGQQLRSKEIEKIFNLLEERSIKDKEARKDHVSRTKWRLKIAKMKEQVLICPKCGGHLIKRHRRYGEFYGCENFPSCKYKTELNEKSI
jgi:predicted RNA-binding Zn-ribbon protein involved in translation (DUF1610 family)